MPQRRNHPNNFFLGTVRRRHSSPFMPRRRFEQPSTFDNINKLISNTQSTINSFQQVAPLLSELRQLSPIISNLPTLIKLMSALDESPSTSNENPRESDVSLRELDEIVTETKDTANIKKKITDNIEINSERTSVDNDAFIKKEVARLLKQLGIEE